MRYARVILARKFGMCYGVRRAIDIVVRSLKMGEVVYTLGPLVHNTSVIDWLSSMGVLMERDVTSIDRGTLVIPSHGVGPEVLEACKRQGLKTLDATCPNVRRTQQLVERLTRSGYQVVIVGDPDHTEVKGLAGYAGGKALVVSSAGDVRGADISPRAGVVAQSTLPLGVFCEVVEALKARAPEIIVNNTICAATSKRQEAARELARQADLVLVIGSETSANARRLKEIVEEEGTRAELVENARACELVDFSGVKTLGVTAGASTPSWVIEEVLARMSAFGEENEGAVGMADVERELHEGDLVRGTVVKVGQDEVLVDIGYKSEGVIPLSELSTAKLESASEAVSVGDEIDVEVLSLEDKDGNIVLSKKRADIEKAWERIMNAMATEEPIEGKVTDVVKGGVVVDVGVRGFVPASHIGLRPVRDLHPLIGTTIRMKVLEAEKDRNNVVLSERAVLEREAQEARKRALESLKEGEVREGIVRRVVNFGAFVDIGDGLEGLLHVSDMTWGRTRDPKAIVSEGEKVRVKVLSVDRERERISLGLKQTMPDPWQNIESRYPIGSIVTGKVTKLVDFGAFVELEDGVEGLVHISQLSDRRVAKPDEVVRPGQEVTVKVISVKSADRRIGLSIKEAQPEKEKEDYRRYASRGTEPAGPTLGDVFGDLFEREAREGKEDK
ncbi:MAG TPA: bifunctional 4-hydroxy-3-methylbut-2-enyl diphosphate reductase/30S ribosomal protein S1 [Firmicutes bacterium]|nr:bifunctional 4-hydroxy-3-methylbut-2-enyl diphosphate reductase/30S ribosomal protein S1 [Bacillota bacterium]